jgi:hypothetical protein
MPAKGSRTKETGPRVRHRRARLGSGFRGSSQPRRPLPDGRRLPPLDRGRHLAGAGWLDEFAVDLVPVLLGAGIPFFGNLASAPVQLETPRVVEGTGVTHLRYCVKPPDSARESGTAMNAREHLTAPAVRRSLPGAAGRPADRTRCCGRAA